MLHGTYKFYFHSHQPQNVLGHSGKAKKGHLCFDAIYETGEISRRMNWTVAKYLPPFVGNLGRVDFINDYEYDLFIRPDTCNPRYRLGIFHSPPWLLIYRFWFNFSVDNVHVDQRIIFNIVNLSKTRNLFTLGLTPIVRSSSRPKWWKSILSILSISYSTLIMWSSRQRIPETNVYYYKSPEHRFEKQESCLQICHQ